jgi:hypothetical protein
MSSLRKLTLRNVKILTFELKRGGGKQNRVDSGVSMMEMRKNCSWKQKKIHNIKIYERGEVLSTASQV